MHLLSLRMNARLLPGIVVLCCTTASAQVVNLADGPVPVINKFDLPAGTGPVQSQADATAAAALSSHGSGAG